MRKYVCLITNKDIQIGLLETESCLVLNPNIFTNFTKFVREL